MLRYLVLCFGVLASVSGLFSEDERTEMQKELFPIYEKCMDEIGLTKEDFETFKKSHNLEDIDPCLFACVMKEDGTLDDQGMINGDALAAFFNKFMKDNDKLNRVLGIAEQCMAVNEEKVSDGVKGCERSLLLAECFIKHKDAILDMS